MRLPCAWSSKAGVEDPTFPPPTPETPDGTRFRTVSRAKLSSQQRKLGIHVDDLLAAADLNGNGIVDEDEKPLVAIIKSMDVDGDGKVGLLELVTTAGAALAQRKKIRSLQQTLLFVILASFAACGLLIGLMVAANEASKDTKPNSSGLLKTVDNGKPVSTGSVQEQVSLFDIPALSSADLKDLTEFVIEDGTRTTVYRLSGVDRFNSTYMEMTTFNGELISLTDSAVEIQRNYFHPDTGESRHLLSRHLLAAALSDSDSYSSPPAFPGASTSLDPASGAELEAELDAELADASGQPLLQSTEPQEVGPEGGGLLLLHGLNLSPLSFPRITVGPWECPVVHRRSDAHGRFLACRIPQPVAGAAGSSATGRFPVSVEFPGLDLSLDCPDCTLTYQAELAATAAVDFSHLEGSRGDSITVVGEGWSLLTDPAVQLSAALGPHPLRFAHADGSTCHPASPLPDTDKWQCHLRIPDMPAGVYPLEITIDRAALSESAIHGRVRFRGGAPVVKVHPKVTRVSHRVTGGLGGAVLRIEGSGFHAGGDPATAPAITDNQVRVGGTGCAVLRAEYHWIECELAPPSDASVAPSLPTSDRGLPLAILPLGEGHADEDCVHTAVESGSLAAVRACNSAGGAEEWVERRVVGGEVLWPSVHPHMIEEGAFRSDRFLASGRATLVAPVTAYYTFHPHCSSLCTLNLTGPTGEALPAGAPVLLGAGDRRGFELSMVHLSHSEQVRVSVTVDLPARPGLAGEAEQAAPLLFDEMPAEWLTFPVAEPLAGEAEQVGVWVDGIAAVCRASQPDGCLVHMDPRLSPTVEECAVDGREAAREVEAGPGAVVRCRGSNLQLTHAALHSSAGPAHADHDPLVLYAGDLELCRSEPYAGALGDSFRCRVPHLPPGTHQGPLKVWVSGAGWAGFPRGAITAKVLGGAEEAPGSEVALRSGATAEGAGAVASLRRLQQASGSAALKWSDLKAAGRCADGQCVVPAEEEWVLDADMDMITLTVLGTLTWDTTKSGLTLKAGWVLVLAEGKLLMGSEEAPMGLPASIYLKKVDAKYAHKVYGERFLGGLHLPNQDPMQFIRDNKIIEASEVTPTAAPLNTGSTRSPTAAPAPTPAAVKLGPQIHIHARQLARTWSLLARPARAGTKVLYLEHDPEEMGWKAGDEIAIATTNLHGGQESTLATIASIGAATEWELTPADSSANIQNPQWNEASSSAIDGSSSTRWVSFGASTSEDYIAMSFAQPCILTRLTIQWDTVRYAKAYKVQVRASATAAWEEAASVAAGAPGLVSVDLAAPSAAGYTEVRVVAAASAFNNAAERLAIYELAAFGREVGTAAPVVVQLESALPSSFLGGLTYAGEGAARRGFKLAAEVLNLQRLVKITGDHEDFHTTKIGLHTIMGYGGAMSVTGTRVEYCGQRDRLGKYCLHWHVLGDCPTCKFQGNAIVESHQKGITLHSTHKGLVDSNTMWNVRGVGIYVEDGNELNNRITSNAIVCQKLQTCQIQQESGIYVTGMTNDFEDNHVVAYQNGIYTPGDHHPVGNGVAWGKVCPVHSPYGKMKGNVNHDTGRFGLYLSNQYPRKLQRDANGMLSAAKSCAEFAADGSDNGAAAVVEDSFEWHNLFTGQYNLGDTQYLRLTSVNCLHGMYWKKSKNFAEGQEVTAHIKDSVFANIKGPAAYGQLQALGPAGPFTFIMENVQFMGDGMVGCGAVCAGQHCGLASHNHGIPASMCNVQYVLKNVDFAQLPASAARIAFGASGGNPVVPIFTSFDQSLQAAGVAYTSMISPHLNGFASVDGCTKLGAEWAGAIGCTGAARRLDVWTAADQGDLKLEGPGYSGVTPEPAAPSFGQNAGALKYDYLEKGYGAVLLAGQQYTLALRRTDQVALDFSDPVFGSVFSKPDTVTLQLAPTDTAGAAPGSCTLSSQDSRNFMGVHGPSADASSPPGSCAAQLDTLKSTREKVAVAAVKSSSDKTNYDAAGSATDGKIATGWSAAAGATTNQWLELVLKQRSTVSHVELWWGDICPPAFEIQVKDQTGSYEVAKLVTSTTCEANKGKGGWELIEINKVATQVRIYNSGSPLSMAVREVGVYGSKYKRVGWDELPNLLAVEGGELGGFFEANALPNPFTPDWCMDQCDNTPGCYSVSFCGFGCWIKDKCIADPAAEPRNTGNAACRTLYKDQCARPPPEPPAGLLQIPLLSASASFVEGPFQAANAIDGNMGTRWASNGDPNQPNGWLALVFKEHYTLSSVQIHWEGAYPSQYRIQVRSSSSCPWLDATPTIDSNGGEDTVDLGAGAAGVKEMRVYGVKYATPWCISVFEIKATGSVAAGFTIPAACPASVSAVKQTSATV